MKFSSILSGVLVVSARIVTAAPISAADAHLPTAMANIQATDAMSGLESSPVVYNRESISGGAAVPLGKILKLLPPSLAALLQKAVGKLFQDGDVVLNVPLDAIDHLQNGNPQQAVASIISNVLGSAGSLPKDPANVFGFGTKKA